MKGFMMFARRDRHQRAWGLFSASIDNRLSAKERRWLDQHLAECGACRMDLRTLEETVQAVRRLPQVSPPRPFRLARPVPQSAPPRLAFYGTGLGYAAAAALMALVAILVVDVARPGGRPDEELPQVVAVGTPSPTGVPMPVAAAPVRPTGAADGAAAPSEAMRAPPAAPTPTQVPRIALAPVPSPVPSPVLAPALAQPETPGAVAPGERQRPPEAESRSVGTRTEVGGGGFPWLGLEVALGSLAAALAAAAVALRWRSRRRFW